MVVIRRQAPTGAHPIRVERCRGRMAGMAARSSRAVRTEASSPDMAALKNRPGPVLVHRSALAGKRRERGPPSPFSRVRDRRPRTIRRASSAHDSCGEQEVVVTARQSGSNRDHLGNSGRDTLIGALVRPRVRGARRRVSGSTLERPEFDSRGVHNAGGIRRQRLPRAPTVILPRGGSEQVGVRDPRPSSEPRNPRAGEESDQSNDDPAQVAHRAGKERYGLG